MNKQVNKRRWLAKSPVLSKPKNLTDQYYHSLTSDAKWLLQSAENYIYRRLIKLETAFELFNYLSKIHFVSCSLFYRELDSVKGQLRKSEGEVSHILWFRSQQVITGICQLFTLSEIVRWRY